MIPPNCTTIRKFFRAVKQQESPFHFYRAEWEVVARWINGDMELVGRPKSLLDTIYDHERDTRLFQEREGFVREVNEDE